MLTSNCRRELWTSPASLPLAFSLVLLLGSRCCEGQTPSEVPLSRARQLILETPSILEYPNALAAIRVVNCLHALGKEQAIALLREIAPEETTLVVAPEESQGEDALTKYWSAIWDAQRVSTIIPLLFEIKPGGTPPPADWYDKDKQRWSYWCGALVNQDGIPFNTSGVWSIEGSLPTTLPLVEWAAAHGELRETPLEPKVDPLQAADMLYFKVIARVVPQFPAQFWVQRNGGMKEFRDHLRAQAIKLLPQALQDRKDLSWDELRKHVSHTGIHWDRDTQAYVIAGDPDIQRCSCPK